MTVVIEMEGDPVAVVEAESGRELSEGERDDVKSTLTDAQSEVVETVESTGGEVQAQMASAYNGVQASVPADQLDAELTTEIGLSVVPGYRPDPVYWTAFREGAETAAASRLNIIRELETQEDEA